MKLIKYRDAGMSTYTYFWTREEGGVISPFFNSEEEAKAWTEDRLVSHEKQKEWEDEYRKNVWGNWPFPKKDVNG